MYSRFFLLTVLAAPVLRGQPVVTIFFPPVFTIAEDKALHAAREVVDESYAEIGIQVVWRSSRASSSDCSHEAGGARIVVATLPKSPARVGEGAFAFSTPYAIHGPCVYLLKDRIGPAIVRNPTSTGLLLGNALAHEMGHVLGIIHHSETGLMKARWSNAEVKGLVDDHLHFTAEDGRMIRQRLATPAQ